MKGSEPFGQHGRLRDLLSPSVGPFQGCAYGLDQRGSVHGLGEKIRCAGREFARAHWDVAMAGEKDDGDEHSRVRQLVLQLQAVEFQHGHVQQETSGVLRAEHFEEGTRG